MDSERRYRNVGSIIYVLLRFSLRAVSRFLVGRESEPNVAASSLNKRTQLTRLGEPCGVRVQYESTALSEQESFVFQYDTGQQSNVSVCNFRWSVLLHGSVLKQAGRLSRSCIVV